MTSDEKARDQVTAMYMSIYQGMVSLVGAQTARLLGADEENPLAVTPEAAYDGAMAMQGLTRAISKIMAPDKPKSDHDFAACVQKFVKQIDPLIEVKFNSKPKDFLMHVTGYAVLTGQDWDAALGDLMPCSIWSTND